MAEYIERRRLFNALADYWKIPLDWDGGIAQPCEDALAFIENAPEEDVAPVVHGRWVQVIHHVEFEDGFVDRIYECCSRCHEPNGRKTSNYCPNCGARMDGEGK